MLDKDVPLQNILGIPGQIVEMGGTQNTQSKSSEKNYFCTPTFYLPVYTYAHPDFLLLGC